MNDNDQHEPDSREVASREAAEPKKEDRDLRIVEARPIGGIS